MIKTKYYEGEITLTFLEKIQPHLLSEDILIQETVLYALHDYPNVPEEWIVILLKEAFHNEEKLSSILIYIDNQTINEEAIELLLENVHKMDKMKTHLLNRIFDQIEPELALKYREALMTFIDPETWRLYELIVDGVEEEVDTEYRRVLSELDQLKYHEHSLYSKAKKLAKCLVQKGWITEEIIDKVIKDELKEQWFSYEGILTVYTIGLLKLTKYIPVLAGFLDREEDILLEETAAALISFQTDNVVRAVEPFVKKSESVIFASSVVENIKSDFAVDVLKEAYHKAESVDEQEIVIEALCHQLSTEALPIINSHMRKGRFSNMVDVEHTAYSCYTILGQNHPDLGKWKQAALKRREHENTFENIDSASEQKIGRNDPCPCGSGKKYKKCCGK